MNVKKLLAHCACAAIALFATPVSGDSAQDPPLFPIKVGDLFGYMDRTGRLVLAPQFGVADFFHEGLAQIYVAPQGSKWTKRKGNDLEYYVNRGFIDSSGKIKFKVNFPQNAEYNKHYLSSTNLGTFSSGRAVVELRAADLSSKYGYIDTTGKLAIPATFDIAGTFSEGVAAVFATAADFTGTWGFVDPRGEYVIPSQFSAAKEFSQGLAAVQDSSTKLWGYIDKGGKYAIAPQFSAAWSFSEGFAVVETVKGRTLVDTGGNLVGPPAPAVGKFSQGLAAVNVGGQAASWPGSAPSEAVTGGKWGFRDSAGNFVIAAQFAFVREFSEGFAAVNTGGTVKDGVVDGGKWGYIDKSGHVSVPPQFDDAADFNHGLANVETTSGLFDKDSRSFYIDSSGNEVKPVASAAAVAAPAKAVAPVTSGSIEAPDPERIARESNELGKQAISDGDTDRALQLFTQAVEADPHFYRAFYNRAQIYVERQNYQQASADFSRALAEQPDLFQAYNNRGNCYMYLGKFQEAVADYTQALKYQPRLSQALVGRAQAYMVLGKIDAAWQDVTTATNQGAQVPDGLVSKLQKVDPKNGHTTEQIAVNDQLAAMRPADLQSAQKISGLFVGVSNYPAQSRVQSTPAHTIGAALFHEIFYRAEANRLKITIQRSGLGSFVSEYRPAAGETLFKYKGGDYFEMTSVGFGALPQPEIPHLKVMADLQIDPADADVNPGAVVRILARIDGTWLQLRDHSNAPVRLNPPGHMWPYFGRGNYITKDAILTALATSLRQAYAGVEQQGEVFVFYVAAHGGLDQNQSPFIITANEQLPDPEILYYADVLKVFDRIQPSAPDKRLLRIVVFDACQEIDKEASAASSTASELTLPPDTVLITSTSPGHYAWQLPSSIHEHHSAEVKVPGSRQQTRVFDQDFSSKASVFPVASDASLQGAQRNAESISLDTWLAGIKLQIPELLASAGIKDYIQTIDWRQSKSGVTSAILFKKTTSREAAP